MRTVMAALLIACSLQGPATVHAQPSSPDAPAPPVGGATPANQIVDLPPDYPERLGIARQLVAVRYTPDAQMQFQAYWLRLVNRAVWQEMGLPNYIGNATLDSFRQNVMSDLPARVLPVINHHEPKWLEATAAGYARRFTAHDL